MFLRDQTVGKYRVLSALGSGGFGTVYLAEDTWIHKKVAIKVPHRQNLDFDEMLKEPRLLASMSHPNIVTVITAERAQVRRGRKNETVFFIVMEYVTGETLEQLILREGAIDLARALDFTCQICNAVDHAHRAGILHRDLRPGNMLLSQRGVLKVTDFGTSRYLEVAAHGTTIIGSPPYMAPEQFLGKAVFASDVYSIGVTMYQMLTGTLPYDTPAPADIERLMRGELITGPRARNSRVPKPIDAIVLKALAPDIAGRYQKASDLLNDLLAAGGRPANSRTHASDATAPTQPAAAGGPEAGGASPAGASHGSAPRRRVAAQVLTPPPDASVADIQVRLKARATPQPRFCWHCRKPLQARTASCPFCGESQ
jgi:serine/threonine-protein kinase